jgi:hypothetical protein
MFRMMGRAFAVAAIALGLTAASFAKSATEIAWTGNTLAGLAFDSEGNAYGVVEGGYGGGGSCDGGCGQVFRLSPASGGGWTQTTIYNFVGGSGDGSYPGGLVVDAAGNIFGTTSEGGSTGCGSVGCGVAYELSHGVGGVWTETILHVFTDTEPQDGIYAGSPLVLDAHGNLYGTTGGGGIGTACNGGGCGVAFKLSRVAGGWNETVLYSFPGGSKGFGPAGALTIDARGNLYGIMQGGGRHSVGCSSTGCGLVYELSKSIQFKEVVLHTFEGPDGSEPNGGLTLDSAGDLYGTTFSGGPFSDGIAYKLSPVSGRWEEESVHSFGSTKVDGSSPTGGMAFDAAGNLYGTTANGSVSLCTDDPQCGQVFELSPSSKTWKLSAVYPIPLGYYSLGGLVRGPDGNIYGTAYDNHYLSGGVAFEIVP